MVVAKIMPAVTTLKARAMMKVTAADVVVEKDLGQIKARELSCQASEASAAELAETKTCGRPVRCN